MRLPRLGPLCLLAPLLAAPRCAAPAGEQRVPADASEETTTPPRLETYRVRLGLLPAARGELWVEEDRLGPLRLTLRVETVPPVSLVTKRRVEIATSIDRFSLRPLSSRMEDDRAGAVRRSRLELDPLRRALVSRRSAEGGEVVTIWKTTGLRDPLSWCAYFLGASPHWETLPALPVVTLGRLRWLRVTAAEPLAEGRLRLSLAILRHPDDDRGRALRATLSAPSPRGRRLFRRLDRLEVETRLGTVVAERVER